MVIQFLNRGNTQTPPQNKPATVEEQANDIVTKSLGNKESLSKQDFNKLFDHLKSWMTKAEEKGTSSADREKVFEHVNSQIVSKYLIVHQQMGDVQTFNNNLNAYKEGVQNFLNEQVAEQEERYENISGSDIVAMNRLNSTLISATIGTIQDLSSELPRSSTADASKFTESEQKQILNRIIANAKGSMHPKASNEENLASFTQNLQKGIIENKANLNQELVQDFLNDIQKDGKLSETTGKMISLDDSKLTAVTNSDSKEIALKRYSRLESNYEQSAISLVHHQGASALEDTQNKAHKLATELNNIKGKDTAETQTLISEYIDNVEIFDDQGGKQVKNEEKTEVAKNYLKLSAGKALKNKNNVKAKQKQLDVENLLGYLFGGIALMTLMGGLFKSTNPYINNSEQGQRDIPGQGHGIKMALGAAAMFALAKESGVLSLENNPILGEFVETAGSKTAGKKAPPPKVNA